VLGTGSDGGYHYLALQFVDGQTLTEYMRDRKSLLPAERITAIINQIAAALDYAHEMGVLHRDIKNGNIMLDKTGAALLTDFGVAKLEDEEFANYTVVGTTVGTPAFMAPEQARGAPVDRRADVYSLGVVAYTLFTGTAPFKADSQPALLHKVVYEPPQPPEEVNSRIPPGVVYVLKKVLSKSPSGRYPTAGAFATALAKGLTWAPTSGEMKAVQDRMLARQETGQRRTVDRCTPGHRWAGNRSLPLSQPAGRARRRLGVAPQRHLEQSGAGAASDPQFRAFCARGRRLCPQRANGLEPIRVHL
jgi:serine/threonine protein kinase